MLGRTSEKLHDPDAVPYFAWDTRQTVSELHQILVGAPGPERDDALVRLLREANTRDVWLITNWAQIEEAWSRIEHRLGRSRPV